MQKYISIYKPPGITPLQLIEKFRANNPEYQNINIGYAGRLDPLAHGIMLLLIGEENKNREEYLHLNKTYQFSVLFGVSTDSYDYLGFLSSLEISEVPKQIENKLQSFIQKHLGKIIQPFPPFSSKPLNGIPLYKLAKKNKIADQDLPSKEIEILDFKLNSLETINSKVIKQTILTNLKKIQGHFRQTKTIQRWKQLFTKYPNHQFTLAYFEISCSSGTYVRSLANKMGQEFGCQAIAFEIYRTKVGEYEVNSALKFN